MSAASELILARKRLRWRARRGLLENDLILARFFAAHGEDLTTADMVAVETLLDLPETELLDVLLARTDPCGACDVPEVCAVVQLLRAA